MSSTVLGLILILVVSPLSFARIKPSKSSLRKIGDHHTRQKSAWQIFPSLSDTIELAQISSAVYSFTSIHATNCSSFPIAFHDVIESDRNSTYTCHMYERNEQDTQVLIVSRMSISQQQKDKNTDYIAVVYAGTDDFRNALTDSDILTTPFGPNINGSYPLSPSPDVHVHAGFNHAVFENNLFDRILSTVQTVTEKNTHLRIFTTGHSLGAADSILTAVAFSPHFDFISSINFGSPKAGNRSWREYVHSLDNVGIWRFVNRFDLVPRLPDLRFVHVGHTLQLNNADAKAYWFHEGNQTLGFRGVPFGWSVFSFALAPAAAIQHMIGHYIKYFMTKSVNDKENYFITHFEPYDDNNHDDGVGDDAYIDPPDDDLGFRTREQQENLIIAREFAEIYLELFRKSFIDNSDSLRNSHLRFRLSTETVVTSIS